MEDVLARRVRLLIESPDAGASAAPEVVAIMAGLLGWNRRRRAAELRRYLDFAAANAAALTRAGPVRRGSVPWRPSRPEPRAAACGHRLQFYDLFTRDILATGKLGSPACPARVQSAPRTAGVGRWTSIPMWCLAARSWGCSSG